WRRRNDMLSLDAELMQKKRYTGYAIVKKKGAFIKFQYTPYPEKRPLLISRSRKVVEFIERLMPDRDEIRNVYALTEKKWQKAIIFAVSVKFFKDVKTLNRFADFLLELDSMDLLYWYDHIRRFIEFPEYRDRVVKAMLTLFDFI
ncbi:MAG: hypothetical protein QW421_06125, partial [Archaeoglobaceae archaeon]